MASTSIYQRVKCGKHFVTWVYLVTSVLDPTITPLIHPFEDRLLTLAELAAANGFPYCYRFWGNQREICVIIANAFAAPCVFALGISIQLASSNYHSHKFQFNYYSMPTIFSDKDLADAIIEWYPRKTTKPQSTGAPKQRKRTAKAIEVVNVDSEADTESSGDDEQSNNSDSESSDNSDSSESPASSSSEALGDISDSNQHQHNGDNLSDRFAQFSTSNEAICSPASVHASNSTTTNVQRSSTTSTTQSQDGESDVLITDVRLPRYSYEIVTRKTVIDLTALEDEVEQRSNTTGSTLNHQNIEEPSDDPTADYFYENLTQDQSMDDDSTHTQTINYPTQPQNLHNNSTQNQTIDANLPQNQMMDDDSTQTQPIHNYPTQTQALHNNSTQNQTIDDNPTYNQPTDPNLPQNQTLNASPTQPQTLHGPLWANIREIRNRKKRKVQEGGPIVIIVE